jgi:hypothetical protein
MSKNELLKHAIRIRWRSFSAEVTGCPAITVLGLGILLRGVGHLPAVWAHLMRLLWSFD